MAQSKPTLSIIVTVYNIEKYLADCLDSILLQSEKDYEIVLINNNSTDNSGLVCSDYASRFSQIRYFSLDGEAVMWRAHRYGLEKACGKYIWFVDGDDLLVDNACEIAIKALQDIKADVYFGRFNTFLEGNVSNFADSPYESERINKKNKDEVLEYLIEKQQPVLPTWRLIYSRELYKNVIAQENFIKLMRNAHQDTGLNVLILISANLIHYIDRPLYNYRIRETSISRTDSQKKILAYCKALIVFVRISRNLSETDSEKNFAYAYYKQFLFLISTIVGATDSHWSQEICDDVDYYVNLVDIKPDSVLAKDFFLVDTILLQGTDVALTLHKEYCQNKIKQIAVLVRGKNSNVYLAPTGNVGMFLKTALEQQGIIISGFFDNDKAKDGMCVARAVVYPPSVAYKIAKNQPITILIGASYVSVPKQLKEQFVSLGIPENDLLIIEL